MDETSDDRFIRRLSELKIQQQRDITQVAERQNKERKDLIDKTGRAITKNRRRPSSDKKIKTRHEETLIVLQYPSVDEQRC